MMTEPLDTVINNMTFHIDYYESNKDNPEALAKTAVSENNIDSLIKMKQMMLDIQNGTIKLPNREDVDND